MSQAEMNEYKKTKRRQSRARTRESLFIADYLEMKYNDVYTEVAKVYNSLNKKYPQKPDLRRTPEFRAFKNKTKPKYNRSLYEGIILTKPLQPLSMQLEIPLLPSPKCIKQSTRKDEQTTMDEIIQEGDQQQQDVSNIAPSLMENLSPEVVEQTTMDEIIQEGDQQQQDVSNIAPSLMENLSPEVVDKIIEDLRNDPNMHELMSDVEKQIEEELLEIDIPEIPDLLEEELARL